MLAGLCSSTYGWTMQCSCLAVNVFLERFWRVKQHVRDYNESLCLASPLMDKVWCLATSFTRDYRLLCGAGPLYEHRPLLPHQHVLGDPRYRRTLKLLAELFPGEQPDPVLFPAAAPGGAEGTPPSRKRGGVEGAGQEEVEEGRRVRGREAETEMSEEGRSGGAGRMQVFVRGEKTYTLDVSASETVEEVKRRLSERTGVPAEMLFLILGGKCLGNHFSLADYGVQRGSTLLMGLRPHVKPSHQPPAQSPLVSPLVAAAALRSRRKSRK